MITHQVWETEELEITGDTANSKKKENVNKLTKVNPVT